MFKGGGQTGLWSSLRHCQLARGPSCAARSCRGIATTRNYINQRMLSHSAARQILCLVPYSPHVNQLSKPLDLDVRGMCPFLQNRRFRIWTGAQCDERFAQQDKVDEPADLEQDRKRDDQYEAPRANQVAWVDGDQSDEEDHVNEQ